MEREIEARCDKAISESLLRQCWLAASLEPTWELPLQEIGIMYFKAERIGDARQHLSDRPITSFLEFLNEL